MISLDCSHCFTSELNRRRDIILVADDWDPNTGGNGGVCGVVVLKLRHYDDICTPSDTGTRYDPSAQGVGAGMETEIGTAAGECIIAELSHMCVSSLKRGHGIGRALLKSVLFHFNN